MTDATWEPASGTTKRWLARDEFVERVLRHQADPELAEELGNLVSETTDAEPSR